jgi:hypothetical protein
MKSRLKTPLLVTLVVVQAFFYPMTTFADDSGTPSSSDQSQSSATSTTPNQGPQNTTGPNKPNGADASTYTYNKDTGLWENDLYTWNPVTHQTQPKASQTYSYNPTSNTWDTTNYHYDPASGHYVPQTVQTTQPPAGTNTAFATASVPGATATAAPGSATSNTGAFDLFNGTLMSNGVFSYAQTGDASVSGNTNGGSASTGNALSAATILNLLQSSYGLQGGAIDTFSVDLTQPHFGDLTLDPGSLPNGKSLDVAQANPSSALAVNISNDTAMNNNVAVAAGSGNASVSGNTNGGNANSGDATALVNLINLINSSISAGHSFIGTLNVGDLNGDILLPQSLKEHLLASNAGNTGTTNTNINSTNNTAVTNNTDLNAASGAATVDQNTNAGSATTGTAKTNLTLLNLTGQQVIAKNSLLVFVNVLGNWVGAIMNAPTGATAAAIGDDSAAVSSAPSDLTLNSDTHTGITNNIDASAVSGNASVDHNTTGGNAKSGNANVGVNIANLANSSFSLADWFGVLFINVLGNWNGSFGVDTAAGNNPAPEAPQTGSTNGTTQKSSPLTVAFQAFASSSADGSQAVAGTGTTSDDSTPAAPATAHTGVLGASTGTPKVTAVHKISNMAMFFGISVLAGLILLGIDRLLSIRKNQAAA